MKNKVTYDDFCAVELEQIRVKNPFPYDVFIQLAADNFVKVLNAGENLDADAYTRFKQKKVTKLYLRREDFARFIGFKETENTEELSKKDAEKFEQFYGEANASIELLFVNEMNEFTLEVAGSVVEDVVNALGITKNSFALIKSLATSKLDDLYMHSLAVSLVSVLVCRKHNWPMSTNVHKVGLAGLLHDLGKKKLTKEYINKLKMLSKSDRKKVDQKIARVGADLLVESKCVQTDIVGIVAHHKDSVHQPNNTEFEKDKVMAHIVGMADTFCELTITNDNLRVDPKNAIRIILESGEYDHESLVLLAEEFGVTIKGKELIESPSV